MSIPLDANGRPVAQVGFSKPASLSGSAPGGFTVYAALIDTGADCTCVSPVVAAALNLTPFGQRPIASASAQSTPHNEYLVDIALPMGPADKAGNAQGFVLSDAVVVEFAGGGGVEVLLGRDILSRGLLQITGWDRRVIFCM